MSLGTIGGFLFGSVAIIESGRRSGMRAEAIQTLLLVVVLLIMVVLGWTALSG